MLYNAKENKEEVSSAHEGESSSLESSEISKNVAEEYVEEVDKEGEN